MCILLNVKKHEKTFALNVDIFKKYKFTKIDFLKSIFCDILVYILKILHGEEAEHSARKG